MGASSSDVSRTTDAARKKWRVISSARASRRRRIASARGSATSFVRRDSGDWVSRLNASRSLVAVPELLMPGGAVMVAAVAEGFGFRAGAGGGQAGVPGGGADLAELVTDPLRCPGGFDGVGVAQVQQPPVGHAADVWSAGRAEIGRAHV